MVDDIVLVEKCTRQEAKSRIGKYGSRWPGVVKVPQENELNYLRKILLK